MTFIPHYATSSFRQTVARIDLAAFAANVRSVTRRCGTRVMGVIKADAYGHGAAACARVLEQEGAAYAGVALAEEALDLRDAGVTLPILVLGRVPHAALPGMVAAQIDCTLTVVPDLLALEAEAVRQGKQARAHVKVDTGMSRLGLMPQEVAGFMDAASGCPHVDLAGIYTHLSWADAPDPEPTRRQCAAFETVLALLGDRGARPDLAHVCASWGIHNAPEAWHDMVRAGVCLYGGTAEHCGAFAVRPVMCLETVVSAVRNIPAGSTVSYGNTFLCRTDRRIAVLPVGYADGLPRSLSGQGAVWLDGSRAPIVGRVCMDMTMIDVTGLESVGEGSRAVLFGNPEREGAGCPTVNDVASMAQTIPYEVMCGISKRVPRKYA